jgi:transcriptional regulator with XRE-family HTH domain
LNIEGTGDVIRQERIAGGYPLLKDFALLIGMPDSTLSRYERNERALTLEAIEQIAAGLERPAELLILKCLQARYPKLKASKTGALLIRLADEIQVLSQKRSKNRS